jgi:uncharacterized protein (DUF1501 family)
VHIRRCGGLFTPTILPPMKSPIHPSGGPAACAGNPLSRGMSNRREFLFVGLAGGLGLTLPNFFRLQAAQGGGAGRPAADAVINLFLPGGMSAQESFDPKPYAPGDYRGPFGSVATKLPGVHFGEKLPRLAAQADRLAVIRSMTHGEAAHERGTHNLFTGYRPSPALEYPSMGSIVAHELGGRNNLPPYVCVPNVPNEFAGSGFLSNAFGPFGLGSDPARGDFTVRDLALPQGVDADRFHRRRTMLETVDAHFRSLESSDALASMDAFYDHAYKLISSQEAREAFNLKAEPDALKDSYGRNAAGMRLMMARRLVEAGVRFVSLTYGSWDHHGNIKGGFENQIGDFDRGVAALLEDLAQRGMLERTLVLVTTEFGRTPKINPQAGRDHWPRVFSIAMAGGGLKAGVVHGASDSLGGEPETDPVTVEDFAATVYHQLGLDLEKRLMAPGDRPVPLVNNGKPLDALLA